MVDLVALVGRPAAPVGPGGSRTQGRGALVRDAKAPARMTPTVAALFVQRDGVYSTMPGVDVWHLDRDAMLYTDALPVVEHPPCGQWGFAARRWRRVALGQDGGRFAHALGTLDRVGGVIEHPAGSSAWTHFSIPRPGGWGWTPAGVAPAGQRWTCAVDQGHFGHEAPKRTWLLVVSPVWVGRPPPTLPWGPSNAQGRVVDMPDQLDREATPPAFAQLLVALATGTLPDSDEGDVVLVSDRCALERCPNRVEQSRHGPRRRYCSEACRQRVSRQRRAGGTDGRA